MTQTEAPAGQTAAEAKLILEEASRYDDLGRKIARVSSKFLGRPYVVGPLEGDRLSPEVFKVSLDGFDCVTYMETALAFAQSRTLDEFIGAVRGMRYAGGEVGWRTRNHYMLDWVRNNEARGIIRDLTGGALSVEKTRTLAAVDGLPHKRVTFRCFPKKNLAGVRSLIQTGDLILFASTRRMLDVFHTGLLIKDGEAILLRHATRTAGAVIEQSLKEFLSAHRMSGFILLRPLCQE
ncbi:MAG: N-acetylmuramoyl-L-alanine amidase-like domain-containing protein [Blastocatellia bacterium]